MAKSKHKRCSYCGYLDMIKKGRHSGHLRYYCKNCKSYFTGARRDISITNKISWFRAWIVGKRTLSQLAHAIPCSERTLKRYFYEQLPRCPVWHIQRREKVNLLIDGTYFPNKVCLVLYRDVRIRMTILYRLTDGERLGELKEYLQNIKNTGIQIGVSPAMGPQISSKRCERCPQRRSCSGVRCISPARWSYGSRASPRAMRPANCSNW